MGGYNIGDILYQLLSFGFVTLFIFLIVFLFRSFSKRRKQLNNIERKVDLLNDQVKKGND
ncbi:DUF4083 domain-containing protein [Rossellomorea vietnamensis]|uniref:DUF4083 domain-containing protein n=1 Tax=Rossellomorea vietnamensis TaxID=218284 RepID=UPI003CF743C7